jgi:hypothetical protein
MAGLGLRSGTCACSKDAPRSGAKGFVRPGTAISSTSASSIPIPLLGLIFLIFSAFPFASSLRAQSQASASDDSRKTFSVSGNVVNSVTGEPVSRALVQIFVGGQKSALTGPDGHFEFSGVPGGQTAVNAEKPGFFNEEQLRLKHGWVTPTLITVGPETPAVTVKLFPESVIVGHVTANGEAVEGVPVKVMEAQVQDGRREWAVSGGATTDDDGEFRIPNLMAGDYFLELGPKYIPGGTPAFKGHESGYGRTFYPSAPAAESSALTVGAGQRSEVEVSLKLEPWYRVSGAVRGGNGTANANVELVDDQGETMEGAQLNPSTGEFEVHAPAGNYVLHAQGFGPRGLTGSAVLPLNLNSDVSELQVAIGPAQAIPVRVKQEQVGQSGTGGAGPTLAQGGVNLAANAPAPVSMWLRRVGTLGNGMTPMVTPDDTGKQDTLAVRNLTPGTYWVELMRNPPWYVESAQCGDVDLLHETLTVGTSAPCAEIDVVLRNDGAALHVNPMWDDDPAMAWVILMPERAPGESALAQVAKGEGTEITELAPGDYDVLLVDRAQALEYKNPEAMEPWMSKAAHVTLSANQKATVSVDLVRVGK